MALSDGSVAGKRPHRAMPASPTAPTELGGREEMSRAERKRTERARLVEQAAAKLFAERGYEGTYFTDVGATLDMRGASLYYYVSSKEELFLRCMEHSAAEVFARLSAIAESDEQPLERLRLLFREQALIALRDFPPFVPLFLKVQLPVVALEERRRELRRQHAQIFLNVAEELPADPSASRADQPRLSVLLAMGALAGLGEWFDPSGKLSVEDLAETVSHTLIGTFGAAPRPRP